MSLVGNRLGQNREISRRSKQVQKGAENQRSGQTGRVRTGRSGIYTNNAGELDTKTQDNLAEDKRK